MDDTLDKKEKLDASLFSIQDHCRICLSVSDLTIPIFEGEGLEHQLVEKIQKYLPVRISKTDSLPHQICIHCKCTLLAWDTLYSSCLKANEKLQSLEKGEVQLDFDDKICEGDNEVMIPLKKRKLLEINEVKNNEESTLKLPVKFRKSKLRERLLKLSKRYKRVRKKMLANSKLRGKSKHKKSHKHEIVVWPTIQNDSSEMNSSLSDFAKLTLDDRKTVDGSGETPNSELRNDLPEENLPLTKDQRDMPNISNNSEILQCKLCNNIYKTKSKLDKHHFKEHLTDQVECPICHVSFKSKRLNSHLKTVHNIRPQKMEKEKSFKCQLCDKLFKNKYVRNAHEREVHLSEPIQCKLCDFKGPRRVLKRHKRYVHVEKRFRCSLCSGAFKTHHTLKLHMTSHSDVRCYTCDVCGLGFKRLNNVRDHMKCHEQKRNQCQICGNFFARKRYLAIHEKTIHNFYADGIVPENKGFECELCGAKLKWKKNMLAHMRLHTGEKPYSCKICQKSFKCHGSLRVHVAKHARHKENEAALLSSQISLIPQ